MLDRTPSNLSPQVRGILMGTALGTSLGVMFATTSKDPLFGLGLGLLFAVTFSGSFASYYKKKETK